MVVAHCRLEFPLKDAESILETDAPTPAIVFGGTLDTSNAPDPTGRRILGGGPRFEFAHLLSARGVPFIFLTGYDPNVVPADLENVTRLQKPVAFRNIVEAVAQL